MLAILHAVGMFAANMLKSRRRLEAENLFLRHQLSIALRCAPSRLRLRSSDRALLVWITWIWPNLLDLAQVVKPGHDPAVASCRTQNVLALEIAKWGRAAKD